MISRYARKPMEQIWEDQNRFQIWLQIETLALEQMVKEGLAPASALAAVKEKGAFQASRVLEIEAEVKHDVIAFLTNVAENAGPEARYLHRGMTSSDVLDTCLAVQMKQSGEMILKDLDECLLAIKKKALEYKNLPCIGRSHGIHAEPTTLGIKFLSWYAEMQRQRTRFVAALEDIKYGKIAGAVGTYASVSPAVEKHVLSQLGLQPEAVPGQIVWRDRHAAFFSALAQIGTSIERACVEIRHLMRTEVGEVCEEFTKGQKGSSAMPHKKNPILSENLCGLARLLRSYSQAALENVPLWHERDISHSSVERVIGPDACILADFMLSRFTKLVSGLVVFPDQVQKNLELSGGLIYSGTLLLALVDAGVKREDAYRLVQKNAHDNDQRTFQTRVLQDSEISKMLSPEAVRAAFDVARHTKHAEEIFNRVLN